MKRCNMFNLTLDFLIDEGLTQNGIACETINRVQRLLKKARLRTTEDVGLRSKVTANPRNIPLHGAPNP